MPSNAIPLPARPESADELIRLLDLKPHPEGGFYRETWRDRPADGSRGAGTAIYFLLPGGVANRWHRVDAAEVWVHAGGGPLVLETWAEDDTAVGRQRLGGPGDDSAVPQHVVDAGVWQRSVGGSAWSLVTCVVVPEFRPEGFEMAADDWSPPVA